MAIWMNGSLRLCLVGVAVAGLVDFAPIPAAGAQWLPPWGGASPGEIERSLEAQGYGLIAPLVRRPGIYLADVSAGPAGYQRLVVDARSGQILQRFVARGRIWGPALAARDEEFGEPVPLGVGSAGSSGFSGLPVMNPPAKKSYGGPANVHIPAATSPFGAGGAPAGRKPKLVSPAAAAKPPSIPPLPPFAPRDVARADGSGSPATKSAEKDDPHPPKIDSRPAEVDNVSQAALSAAPSSSAEPTDRAKVSIVSPALFE
jgi:hypothetical protein